MSTTNINSNAPEMNNNEKFNAMLNPLKHGREVFNILKAVALVAPTSPALSPQERTIEGLKRLCEIAVAHHNMPEAIEQEQKTEVL